MFNGGASYDRVRVVSHSEARQFEIWEENVTGNGKLEQTTGGTVGDRTSNIMTFREPLVLGQFGCLGQMSAHPAWSCEANKSPSILHCNTMQITFNMVDIGLRI